LPDLYLHLRKGQQVKKIRLTKGLFALVDDEDFERVNQFKWCASLESRGTKYYAIRWVWNKETKRRVKIRMHRFIMDLPPGSIDGLVVDHINDDGLDNRRSCNLEVITAEENLKRSTWNKPKKKAEEVFL